MTRGAPEGPATTEQDDVPAGWYESGRSLRYWDGESWTDQRAPLPTNLPEPLTRREIAGAVTLGVLGAWFVVLLLAQISPDNFYLPVKFVVEELPGGFR